MAVDALQFIGRKDIGSTSDEDGTCLPRHRFELQQEGNTDGTAAFSGRLSDQRVLAGR
jgi:hypothetical protein